MITFNQFASFLKEECAYKVFFEDVRNQNKVLKSKTDEEIFDGILDKYFAITGLFVWDFTPEAHDYWDKINNKYKDFYQKCENVNKNVDLYEFKDENIEKVRVLVPDNLSEAQKGFVKSWIRKNYPDVRVLKEDKGYICGFVANWQIVKK
jgi:hypothetical protein